MAYKWFYGGGDLVTKLCPTFLQPQELWSWPGSPDHGVSQARILERVVTSSQGTNDFKGPQKYFHEF